MNFADLAAIAAILILSGLGISIIMGLGAMEDAIKSDQPNWGTVVTLDLPVNVTRIIQQDDTTFIYQATGDEESILFSGLGLTRVVKDPTGNVIEVFTTESLKLNREVTKRPVLEMLIIRDDGSRETHTLPTRDGGT